MTAIPPARPPSSAPCRSCSPRAWESCAPASARGTTPTRCGWPAARPRAAPGSARPAPLAGLAALSGLPGIGELPPPDIFLGPECRNIYRAICTLYAEGGAAAVDSRAVLAKVASEQATIDRMAQILLEKPFDPAKFSLSESLDKLIRRWRQTRLRELQSEIVEAQRKGDWARLASLVEERTSVSQSLQGVGPGDRGEPGDLKRPGRGR